MAEKGFLLTVNIMKRIYSFLLLLFFCGGAILGPIFAFRADAAGASLFFSPSGGSYELGKSFTVKAMINSGGGSGINASEGVIKFNPAEITVVSVSESGSIFKLWTTNPTFSNTAGTISYGGGLPGSSYAGSAGTIFSIIFKAKKVGTASISFSSGSALANDGKGTDVLSGRGSASFTINEPAPAKEEPKTEPKIETKPAERPKKEEEKNTGGILPPLPEINSSKYAEDDKWYTDNEPEFNWKLLSDLTGISYAINEKADADPGSDDDGVVESKKFDKVKDGIWYFHMKFKNKSGWGQTAHKKFMVDATAPLAYGIGIDNGGDTTNPSPKLKFETKDEASGIDYYKILADGVAIKVQPSEIVNGAYVIKAMAPGEYSIEVIAYDKAGNSASSTASLVIDPLRAPVITDMPKIMNKGEDLIIRGSSFYPQTNLKVFISKDGKDPEAITIKTDDSGDWSYFHKGLLDKGNYEIWTKLIDDRGAQSSESSHGVVTVVAPSIVDQFGVMIIFILLVIIAGLVIYIVYQKKKFMSIKMRIKSETEEVKIKLRKIFSALREEVDELIELADKKIGLSEPERRIKEKLQESLDISEEFINKEVEDVEKEINLSGKN